MLSSCRWLQQVKVTINAGTKDRKRVFSCVGKHCASHEKRLWSWRDGENCPQLTSASKYKIKA